MRCLEERKNISLSFFFYGWYCLSRSTKQLFTLVLILIAVILWIYVCSNPFCFDVLIHMYNNSQCYLEILAFCTKKRWDGNQFMCVMYALLLMFTSSVTEDNMWLKALLFKRYFLITVPYFCRLVNFLSDNQGIMIIPPPYRLTQWEMCPYYAGS